VIIITNIVNFLASCQAEECWYNRFATAASSIHCQCSHSKQCLQTMTWQPLTSCV